MEQIPTGAARLALITVKTPCFEDWSKMVGDERKRLCEKCNKPVFNLRELSEDEALQLLNLPSPVCMRLYRRADGTVITKECVGGRHRRWRNTSFLIAALATVFGSLGLKLSWADSSGGSSLTEPGPMTMGEAVLDPLSESSSSSSGDSAASADKPKPE